MAAISKRTWPWKIPEHFIPAFKPAKEFVQAVKDSKHELVEHNQKDLVDYRKA